MHHLVPERRTLHGQFSADLPPALSVASGERVRCTTLDVTWGLAARDPQGFRPTFSPREAPRDNGPCMLGPIAVQGARPGHVLEVHLEAIIPGDYGWTYAGEIGFFNTELNRAIGVIEGEAELLRWEIDAATKVATSHTGFRVPLQPFLGTIGLCPRGTGWQSAWPPYTTGGNLDCKDLVAGSILYLPVEVDGALLSLGDGHAAQGDGESGGTAIECPMERVDLRLVLRDDLDYTRIIADTPSGWITFGFDESLDAAVVKAIDGMLQLLQRRYPISRKEALGLVSVAVDVRITQLVNGVRGVHACLPHDAITDIRSSSGRPPAPTLTLDH